MLSRLGLGAETELLRRQEFHAGQIFHGLEPKIRCDQNMIFETHGKFERDRIRVGEVPVDFDSGSEDRAITGERNDFRLTGKNAAQDAFFLHFAKALAQVAGNLTPLHG